jgi:hypothetical protein
MKIYPPLHLTLRESQEQLELEKNIEAEIVSDENLIRYYKLYFESYRKTLEDFFPDLAPHLGTYQSYPYKTTVVKWGEQIFTTFHQPFTEVVVEFKKFEDFGLESGNFFDLKALFDPCAAEFDFRKTRRYDEIDAEIRGKAMALDEVLQVFWLFIATAEDFEKVCLNLIEAETADYLESKSVENLEPGIDLKLEILLSEIAGFRRTENWGFIFKHFKEDRITADLLHQVETQLNETSTLDVICLVTSGDVTSIGKSIAVGNPRIRIWDRHLLNQLINKHLSSLGEYLQSYKIAVESIAPQIEKLRYSRHTEFKNKLESCPAGLKHFSQYEAVCKQILEYLFDGKLKFHEAQSYTRDKTQRRDILGRNLRNSSFFERIFGRFKADFVIFDPKNNAKEITKKEFESISKYPNKAIGMFAVLISRKGADKSALDTQNRIYVNEDKVILSISDENLLEMILRKEREENPEDLLEDLLDEFLKNF